MSQAAIRSPNQPRKLAFLITELEIGGAERCLTNLVLGLDRRRFEPAVYSLWPRPLPEQDELVASLESAGVPVHFLELRLPRHLHQGSRKLNRLLASQRPDLLQTFLFHANILGAFTGWRLKVPRIVQGMRVADRSAWRMMLERVTARFADRIVCVSESVAAMAREEVRLPPEKLCVIPNGIDANQYPAPAAIDLTALGVPLGRRAIAVIGRLHAQKGLDWLLRVAPRILRDFPDVDFVLAGRGPDAEPLRQLADSLQIGSRVHLVGWRSDVPAILRSCSLLILPSRWEGMPNVLLEAMASALPVVATQAEGVTEILGPLADRQVVRFGDDEGLLDCVASFLRDASYARHLGALNRSRVESEFSLPQMVARYERLYGELLETC
jgi:glycosyltransferase involved in cell wall biosynthesis